MVANVCKMSYVDIALIRPVFSTLATKGESMTTQSRATLADVAAAQVAGEP